jgi:hypothetical protein
LNFLEAASGFEPLYNGFADRSLTTWVCRRLCNHSPLIEKAVVVKPESWKTTANLFCDDPIIET